jgi:hypothetical protein
MKACYSQCECQVYLYIDTARFAGFLMALYIEIVLPVEEYCRLGCDTLYSGRNLLTFRWKVPPPFSGLENKPSTQPGNSKQCCVHNLYIMKLLWSIILCAIKSYNAT